VTQRRALLLDPADVSLRLGADGVEAIAVSAPVVGVLPGDPLAGHPGRGRCPTWRRCGRPPSPATRTCWPRSWSRSPRRRAGGTGRSGPRPPTGSPGRCSWRSGRPAGPAPRRTRSRRCSPGGRNRCAGRWSGSTFPARAGRCLETAERVLPGLPDPALGGGVLRHVPADAAGGDRAPDRGLAARARLTRRRATRP
jgi:hypothetical protein